MQGDPAWRFPFRIRNSRSCRRVSARLCADMYAGGGEAGGRAFAPRHGLLLIMALVVGGLRQVTGLPRVRMLMIEPLPARHGRRGRLSAATKPWSEWFPVGERSTGHGASFNAMRQRSEPVWFIYVFCRVNRYCAATSTRQQIPTTAPPSRPTVTIHRAIGKDWPFAAGWAGPEFSRIFSPGRLRHPAREPRAWAFSLSG